MAFIILENFKDFIIASFPLPPRYPCQTYSKILSKVFCFYVKCNKVVLADSRPVIQIRVLRVLIAWFLCFI